MSLPIDLGHCPTCGHAWESCGAMHPSFVADVVPVRCRLPRGHTDLIHWHPELWPGTAPVVWSDEQAADE
jgi:hypothetical protein